MLHIINKSPYTSSALQDCLRFITAQDAILLIEDGVYAAMDHELHDRLAQISVYILQEDMMARGLSDKIASLFKVINYDGFVDLTIAHHPIQTWS